MTRIKSNKWKNVPVQPYTVTTENGIEIINPLRSGPNMGLIPVKRFSQPKVNLRGNVISNNRTQSKSSRLHPVQYVPNTVHLQGTVGHNKEKIMISVKDGSYRKVSHTRAY